MSDPTALILAQALAGVMVLGTTGAMLWFLRDGWRWRQGWRPFWGQIVAKEALTLQTFAARVGGTYEAGHGLDVWGGDAPVAGSVTRLVDNRCAPLDYALHPSASSGTHATCVTCASVGDAASRRSSRSSGPFATPRAGNVCSFSPASRRSGSTSARRATAASSSSSRRTPPPACAPSRAGPSWAASACAILRGERLERRHDDPQAMASQQTSPSVRDRAGGARVLGAA